MPSLMIRNVDPVLKERLRVHAARQGRSMEAELRIILSRALAEHAPEPANLVEAIRRRFASLGGVDLDVSQAEMLPAPIDFADPAFGPDDVEA